MPCALVRFQQRIISRTRNNLLAHTLHLFLYTAATTGKIPQTEPDVPLFPTLVELPMTSSCKERIRTTLIVYASICDHHVLSLQAKSVLLDVILRHEPKSFRPHVSLF